MTAQFIGVGVGPGDPELITVKAWRIIGRADVVCYIANDKGESQARNIARDALRDVTKAQQEIPILMPFAENRSAANHVYDNAAITIQREIDAGKTVVFLCEGDPLFFGSFAYLLERLMPENECQVVPGITSVNAAASALQLPLTMLKESFSVISGRHTDEQMIDTLNKYDSVVIMKAGLSRPRILKALATSNRTQDAQYIEYIGRENERMTTDVSLLEDKAGPYFSLFVVTRQNRDSR
ncbi:precorrin-2 C(20)-methyltransferase [Alkalimarinus alittae]|uniref:Precorrin-2 C(20)-methyltransferase n=1 Tax=Alkalimarinus alittae TaxID=2961619 RepID=A0ABY6N5W3_9ALTE|nr:precorrin-2 C(20)-methyltransferase [Alkalimarinus alittae]UZE97486.1 precorrin-2 C(20)-methyltransferase [Alkalimarinus alittae]